MDREGRYPAPWHLRGRGWILLYRFPRDFVLQQGLIPPFLRGAFVGGLGAVMMVDYAVSNAGPYGELLFIPGRFRFRGKHLYSITRIYVSSKASLVNGRENWAIPKEQADFSFGGPAPDRLGRVVVRKEGAPVLDATLKHGRVPLPIHTRFIHFPLVQEIEGALYYTDFTGKGMARLARIEQIRANPEHFPDIAPYRPLLAVWVSDFAITFPPARITGMGA